MTEIDCQPAYTRHFWAKSDRDAPHRVHLLEHHLADVGACFEELLRQPTIRRRLAHTAGLCDLDETTVARLAVLAAIHDIGKVNVGFQTRIWREEDLPRGRTPIWARRVGHTSVLTPVLCAEDRETGEWFLDALGWHKHMSGWDNDHGNTVSAMFIATLSHHGRPLNLYQPPSPNTRIWQNLSSLDPRRVVKRVARLTRDWFPAAFAPGAPPLPSAPQFQHMFLGLCSLADWIASDEDLFSYVDKPDDGYIPTARKRAGSAIRALSLNIEPQRAAVPDLPGFGELFAIEGSPRPNAIQEQSAWKTPLEERLVIIESETGSGKTEAALWRFARMYEAKLIDGLYFALPTRAAASQMHGRVRKFVDRMFPACDKPEPVLAVPGYVRAGDFTGRHLPDFKVLWDDDPGAETRKRLWAAESTKRFLAAQIAVGTVDQAMMAALQVRHSHMRAAGYALLMSATLGSAARRRWLLRPKRANDLPDQSLREAIETAYPAISISAEGVEHVADAGHNDQDKVVSIDACPLMHDPDSVGRQALKAARVGARVLVVRNTVDYAVKTQSALEAAPEPGDDQLMFHCNDVPTLHTGRFAAEDRLLLDAEVEKQLGKRSPGGGRVVVGTQTLEQSLDIDADLLITDLCPMDVLLQRIGRLHRHDRQDRPDGYREPRCIVLVPPHDNLTPLLAKKAGGPARNGLGGNVYPDLRILELTRRLVDEHSSEGRPWRIPKMNRLLVERTTHLDALEALVEELGEDWIEHGNEVEGVVIAGLVTARSVVVRRDLSFLCREVRFADVEDKIRTRLGDEGVEVEFAPAPSSPFAADAAIPKLTIPEHLCYGLTAEALQAEEPLESTPTQGGFTFRLGARGFLYDRLGLRRL